MNPPPASLTRPSERAHPPECSAPADPPHPAAPLTPGAGWAAPERGGPVDRLGVIVALKLALARAAGALARVTRLGGGTSLPGRLLIRLEPHAIRTLSRRLARGSLVVSATNGKTTTAALVASVLGRTGVRLAHNRAGANMAGGVASALVASTRLGRGAPPEMGLFEVDEFWLGRVVGELEPRAILLGNLFRDQLDRYGELEAIAERWAQTVGGLSASTRLVLNADDPLIADLRSAAGDPGPGISYFGVRDPSLGLPGLEHAADSKHCRRCGTAYRFETVYLGHLGVYTCPGCGATRPEPEVAAEDVALNGVRSASFVLATPEGRAPVQLPQPGLYNVYNALGAAALCRALGVPLATIVAGLQAAAPVFGRAERVVVAGRELVILLVKNPAGANEVLRTLALDEGELDLLAVLNDGTADGRDVSWVWDADFELLTERVRRVVCSGTRAAELALRLKYGGLDPARIVVEPELEIGLDRALAGGAGDLHVLPTYTALLDLRELLARRGVARPYWA